MKWKCIMCNKHRRDGLIIINKGKEKPFICASCTEGILSVFTPMIIARKFLTKPHTPKGGR